MKRYKVAVTLKSSQRNHAAPARVRNGFVENQVSFMQQGDLRFGLSKAIERLRQIGITPSEVAVDLLLLASAVLLADTRISRKNTAQDGWTREIGLHIPVKTPTLWKSIGFTIKHMLEFLTGDLWHLSFYPRPSNCLAPLPVVLSKPSIDSVCLFSGGLDSFVGAIDLLNASTSNRKKTLFVSHYSSDTGTSSQLPCLDYLKGEYDENRFDHLRARISFPSGLVCGFEPSQRSRSFLFLALASVAASGIKGAPVIHVPENGLISLNVPLDSLRVGAYSTRTTHPYFLMQWQKMLNAIDISARVENRYRFKTKGEMLSKCGNRRLLSRALATTISCSSYGKARWGGKTPQHCGYCVPCLIRRAAIKHAFRRDPTKYSVSASNRTLDPKKSEGENVRAFKIMHRHLSNTPGAGDKLVHVPGPLWLCSSDNEVVKYARVFKRGIDEVGTMLKRVRTRPG